MSTTKLPTPAINEETEAFWQGTSQGQFLLKRCRACQEFHYYPRSICPFCHSDQTEWKPSTGRGTLYSFSTLRRTREPFTLAYVTLDEGVSVLTNIIECDPDALAIGQSVEVVFRQNDDGYHLPFFKPV